MTNLFAWASIGENGKATGGKKSFTVNGKTFDIKLTSGSVDTYVTLAKLRQ